MEYVIEFLNGQFLGKAVWAWVLFIGLVITLLVLDLGVLHRKQREIGVKESLALSAFYMALGLAFGVWVWRDMGQDFAMQYYTGFLIEWSLSLDNVFVISLIMTYFAVPRKYQHRVLFWGIIGVIIMRALLIGVGSALVKEFDWIMYVFAAFLVFTGGKMLVAGDQQMDIENNPVIKYIRNHIPITHEFHKEKFWVKEMGSKGKKVWKATPLFLALVLIELVDLVFAVDSVPAIFAITTEPYIVYTSNIFAILGLRALYFSLAAMIARFRYLKYALALILIMVGGKIVYAQAYAKPDPLISLTATIALLLGGVIYSLWRTRREATA